MSGRALLGRNIHVYVRQDVFVGLGVRVLGRESVCQAGFLGHECPRVGQSVCMSDSTSVCWAVCLRGRHCVCISVMLMCQAVCLYVRQCVHVSGRNVHA